MAKASQQTTSDNLASGESESTKSRFARQWHYRPTVPIQTSPLFRLPPSVPGMFRWLAARWFVFGENTVIAVIACLTWLFFQPDLAQTKNVEFSWVAQMFVRNAVLISIVAGGLHYLLHVKKHQKQKLKFDPRELQPSGKIYTFKNQLHDNMFWTLTSGVFFWTAFEALMLWAMANGHISVMTWRENPVLFVLWFLLTPIWISFHFYWIHRFLHWPPLYKLAHALHHRNTNVGPWSGLSMHPVEHLLFFSSVLIHWVVAAHPIHIFFHMQHQALTASTSHAGFDALLVKDKKAIELGTFHHQMHHRYFECNYGNLDVPWDKLFGSFHDGTESSHEQFLEQRRKRLA